LQHWSHVLPNPTMPKPAHSAQGDGGTGPPQGRQASVGGNKVSSWRSSQTPPNWMMEFEQRQRLQLQEHQRATALLVDSLREDLLKRLLEAEGKRRENLPPKDCGRSRVFTNVRSETPSGRVETTSVAVIGGRETVEPKWSNKTEKDHRRSLDSSLLGAIGAHGTSAGQSTSSASGIMSPTTPDPGNADKDEWQPTSRWQACLLAIVNSGPFQTCTGLLIISYAFLIGLQSDQEMRLAVTGHTDTQLGWKTYTDLSFTGIFALEAVLKLLAEQIWFFKGANRFWNMFDSFLVLTSLVEILNVVDINLSVLRIIRTVRAVRVLRIIRIFRFFRELRLMAASILSCMVSLIWAFVLLLTVMYIFAVALMQGAGEYLRGDDMEEKVRDDLSSDFGNIWRTIYSLTLAVSGGRSWGEYAHPYVEISPWYGFFFMLFIVFVIFGVLNILTGVFVESTHSLANVDKELVIQEEMSHSESVVNQIRALFNEIDVDRSGSLSLKELKRNLSDPRVKAYFSVLQMDITEAEGLFQLLDKDESGEVSIEEFIVSCMRLKGSARSIDLATMLMEHKRMYSMIKSYMGSMDASLTRIQASIDDTSSR